MEKLFLLASFLPEVRVRLEGKPALDTAWLWMLVLGEQGVCSNSYRVCCVLCVVDATTNLLKYIFLYQWLITCGVYSDRFGS
jgi:hypothetical protein